MSSPAKITVGGAPEGFDAQLIVNEINKSDGPVCHIARDASRLAAMQETLKLIAPDLPIFVFPGWDCVPYDRISPNAEISAARMACLAALAHQMPKRFVLLTTLNAATQRVPAREILQTSAFAAMLANALMKRHCEGFSSGWGSRRALQ